MIKTVVWLIVDMERLIDPLFFLFLNHLRAGLYTLKK